MLQHYSNIVHRSHEKQYVYNLKTLKVAKKKKKKIVLQLFALSRIFSTTVVLTTTSFRITVCVTTSRIRSLRTIIIIIIIYAYYVHVTRWE